MNLECLNDIIIDNLAIYIDLTNIKSWTNWNTGLTAFSLTKWTDAISDNINLQDFGLIEFDNGRTNIMWSGITLVPKDILFSMYKIGYNNVINPTTGNTSGITATTQYFPMSATSATGGSLNYFALDGGYLQGFFKLNGYNYMLFPERCNKGITIETLVYLYPDSHGIFYMMGARAEDKYNPYFSGETITGSTSATGVTTSLDNYLDAIVEIQIVESGFATPEDNKTTIFSGASQLNNIKNNSIAFELTQDRKLAYKYINNNGLIITNSSPATVTATGFTMIDIAFTPDGTINDPALLDCAPQRTGKLILYVNGRAVWIIHDFPEFYFHAFTNDKEKQIGVPYSISWGGGSFGLKYSYHYDYQTYGLYTGQDTAYINSNFFVEANPISTLCYIAPTGDTYLSGLTLSADSTTFKVVDECDPTIEHPITVMRIEYTGETGTTTGKTYFIKFNHPISVLSNRNYNINLSIFDNGFFKSGIVSGKTITNKISILPYCDTGNIDILNDTEYRYPFSIPEIQELQALGLYPFPDGQEYEYSRNGILYYGVSGVPIINRQTLMNGDTYPPFSLYSEIVTGQNTWNQMKSVFRTKDNTGQQFAYIGLLIETNDSFNLDKPLFINNFTYIADDILVQDARKNNLTIEQNFGYSGSTFIGGIQKLRIYDNALTSPEILHNALIEAKNNPGLNLKVSKGGRIIYR
jgi:hypothetical protein